MPWHWCKLANFLDLISGGQVLGIRSHCHHVDMAVYLGLIKIGCVRKVVYLGLIKIGCACKVVYLGSIKIGCV